MVEDNNMTKEKAFKTAENLLYAIYCNRDDSEAYQYRALIMIAQREEDADTLIGLLNEVKYTCEKLIETLK